MIDRELKGCSYWYVLTYSGCFVFPCVQSREQYKLWLRQAVRNTNHKKHTPWETQTMSHTISEKHKPWEAVRSISREKQKLWERQAVGNTSREKHKPCETQAVRNTTARINKYLLIKFYDRIFQDIFVVCIFLQDRTWLWTKYIHFIKTLASNTVMIHDLIVCIFHYSRC